MKKKKGFIHILAGVFSIIIMLAACGNGSVDLLSIARYPGAQELKKGESNLGNTLSNNMKTDAELRKSMGPVAGGSVEQKGFKLPRGTKWKDVKAFYEKGLEKDGWSKGLGGAAGKFVDVNKVMSAANRGNALSKTIIFSRGSQTLTIIMLNSSKLILSLASN